MSNLPDNDIFDPDQFSPEKLLKSLFDDEANEEMSYQIETYDLTEGDTSSANENDTIATNLPLDLTADTEGDFFGQLHRESNPYQEEQ